MQAIAFGEYKYFSVTNLGGDGVFAWTAVQQTPAWPFLLPDRKTFQFPDGESIAPSGSISQITMYVEVTGTTVGPLTEPASSYLKITLPVNVGDLYMYIPGADDGGAFNDEFGTSGSASISYMGAATGFHVDGLLGITGADSQVSYSLINGFALSDGSTDLTFDAKLNIYTFA